MRSIFTESNRTHSVGLGVDGTPMVQIPHQSQMDGGGVPPVVLKKGELVEQFLGWMLMLAITGIDARQASSLCCLRSAYKEASSSSQRHTPLQLAAYDEYGVVVTGQGVEGIGIAFPFVEGGTVGGEIAHLGPMEFGCVPE